MRIPRAAGFAKRLETGNAALRRGVLSKGGRTFDAAFFARNGLWERVMSACGRGGFSPIPAAFRNRPTTGLCAGRMSLPVRRSLPRLGASKQPSRGAAAGLTPEAGSFSLYFLSDDRPYADRLPRDGLRSIESSNIRTQAIQ